MQQTKDRQVKKVVTGIALGVLAQGVGAVTSDKAALEFAFNHAWRKWPQAYQFPSIGGHDPGNLFWIGMGKSARRPGVVAAWESGRWAAPYVAYPGWSVDEALDLHADSEVLTEDWIQLGALFVGYFKPHEVLRA